MTSARDAELKVGEILARRAAELARPVETEPPGDRVKVVLLSLDEERYGVEIGYVIAVEPVPEMTPIPGAPAPWIGLINIRGTLVPVIDTRVYMGAETGVEIGPEAKVVLVSDSRVAVGLLADEVSHFSHIPQDEIRPSLARGASGHVNVVHGVTADMVTIIDIDAVLAEASRVVEHEPAAQGGE